jgi:hypothetical protein
METFYDQAQKIVGAARVEAHREAADRGRSCGRPLRAALRAEGV